MHNYLSPNERISGTPPVLSPWQFKENDDTISRGTRVYHLSFEPSIILSSPRYEFWKRMFIPQRKHALPKRSSLRSKQVALQSRCYCVPEHIVCNG